MSDVRPLHLPARVLTLEQAYWRGYAGLRRALQRFCEAEPDARRRNEVLCIMDDTAEELEKLLRDLLPSSVLPFDLARPEEKD